MALRHDIRRGALMMLGATALFTVMSAIIKGVSDDIHFIEIMFFRSAFALPVMFAIAARRHDWNLLRTKRLKGHVVRAFTGTMAQGCSFFALTVLPLAEQTSLSYTTPLFVTILSIPFLGEKVGIHRWSAVLLGFAGILVIALGEGAFQGGGMPQGIVAVGMAAAVVQGVWSAITTLLVRSLSATESSTTIVLWQSLLMTAFTLVALPFFWTTPSLGEFALLVLVGLIGGVAQILLTEAYASAQVSALGPYSYTSILWSVVLGWVVFSDQPSWSTLAGAVLIVASGLYILHRELKRAAMREETVSIPFLKEDALPPGQVEDTAPGVRRLLCGNPGPFTWRGTNSWIIGRGSSVAVLDPGPEDAAHLAALLRATEGERITHILVSHTHRDHSPGVAALQAATGARSYGFGPHMTPPDQGGEGGDHSFHPDVLLPDGASVEGDDWRLSAIHTPGHCANHLCFSLEGTGILFSADHVMSWSTSVVSPPDGDMASYMRSLARLTARDDRLYLPGHGPPLPNPGPFATALAAHRMEREAMVLEALRAAGRATARDLVPPVYGPALDARLVPAAARSLLAHLIKLEGEGAAARDGEHWAAL